MKKMEYNSPVFGLQKVYPNQQIRWKCPKCGRFGVERFGKPEQCIFSSCGYKGKK